MTKSTTFPSFLTLPLEIRLQIWREAMPRRIIVAKRPYYSTDKARLRWVGGCSINACRESRLESSRHKTTATGCADKTEFDPSGDILCLYYSHIQTLSYSDAFFRQFFDFDVKAKVERVDIICNGTIPAGPRTGYETFALLLLPFLRRLPALREVTVGKLRSDRLSMKTGVWGKATGLEKHPIMRKATVRKVKVKVEEAIEKEKLLRPEWQAPSIRFVQLL